MTSTITLGKGGRLVVPKSVRDLLGLREGARLKIKAGSGKMEVVPEVEAVRIEMRDGFPIILGGPPRKRGDIVRAIKAGREEVDERRTANRRRS
jgi:AbrB family looped-hinge helix DNA binding protein